MGIPSFTKFLKAANITLDKCEPFDSILIDAQTFLYLGLENSMKENENDLLRDVPFHVIRDIGRVISGLFNTKKFSESVRIIVTFDGEAVPMKWPTQRKRRGGTVKLDDRDIYKTVLLGNNSISQGVYVELQKALENFSRFKTKFLHCPIPNSIDFYLSSSSRCGEGEHKLFHMASEYECKNCVVVSEDNDVFILSCLNLEQFDMIQISRKKGIYYNVNDILKCSLGYDALLLAKASILFGNDFIPPVVGLSESNNVSIHDSLTECMHEEFPEIFHHVLRGLLDKKQIRFDRVPYMIHSHVIEFFKTSLWIMDYYTQPEFPQKYMKNNIFDKFNRNMIVTALLDLDFSKLLFDVAKETYQNLVTERPRIADPYENVFAESHLEAVKRFFNNIDIGEHCIKIRKA